MLLEMPRKEKTSQTPQEDETCKTPCYTSEKRPLNHTGTCAYFSWSVYPREAEES